MNKNKYTIHTSQLMRKFIYTEEFFFKTVHINNKSRGESGLPKLRAWEGELIDLQIRSLKIPKYAIFCCTVIHRNIDILGQN